MPKAFKALQEAGIKNVVFRDAGKAHEWQTLRVRFGNDSLRGCSSAEQVTWSINAFRPRKRALFAERKGDNAVTWAATP